MKIRKINEAFVAFWSTLILICQPSRITLCDKSCDLERKYVIIATPVSQKRRRQPISFILDSLSAQMNVPDTKFSRNTMKLLNHNASTLTSPIIFFFNNRYMSFVIYRVTDQSCKEEHSLNPMIWMKVNNTQ